MERFELECVDVGLIIYQCVNTLSPLSALSDVKLNVCQSVMNNHMRFFARGAALPIQQVLVNIVGNAIKYSGTSLVTVGESTSIDINIRRTRLISAKREANEALCSSGKRHTELLQDDGDKEVLIVDVRDRGNGIPEEEAGKVFGAFMMLDKHVGKSSGFAQPKGSGFGLQLCTNMMEMMKGCVWANNCDSPKASAALEASGAPSTDVDGCVFSFYLECPTADEADQFVRVSDGSLLIDIVSAEDQNPLGSCSFQSSQPDSSSKVAPTSRPGPIPADLSAVKVMVVDDIVLNVKVISRMLGKLGFREIRCATNGARALQVRISKYGRGCSISQLHSFRSLYQFDHF